MIAFPIFAMFQFLIQNSWAGYHAQKSQLTKPMLMVRALETMHYAARAMGAMTLRISELCLSFSPHPNISDGNVNLVHHFFRIQIFQINEKGSSSAWIR